MTALSGQLDISSGLSRTCGSESSISNFWILSLQFPSRQTWLRQVRSEELPQLAGLLRRLEPFKGQLDVFQLDVILDANVVLGELIWLSSKRKNPQARSNLLELLDCCTVRAHAPSFLLTEVELHLPRLAKQRRVSESAMRTHWERLRLSIRFVDVGGPELDVVQDIRDPKDVPYMRLQALLDAPIATEDKDIEGMGGRVIRVQLFAPLKFYSRNTAIEYRLKVAGMGSALLFTLLLSAMSQGAKNATTFVTKIPPPILLLLVVLIACAFLHPASRKRILEVVSRLLEGGLNAAALGFEIIQPILQEHYAAKQAAQIELEKAKAFLPQPSS